MKYLRKHDLVGISGDAQYHNIQNSFLGIALQDESHPSLPLVSVAIFCCVAQRLGIDAHPVGFPYNVLAMITPPSSLTVKRKITEDASPSQPMYLDPFRTGDEILLQDLTAQLRSLRIPQNEHSQMLGPSRTEEVVLRCANNINTSVHRFPRFNVAVPTSTTHTLEVESAAYAALWSTLIFSRNGPDEGFMQRNHYMQRLLERLERQQLMDVGLVEEHMIPMLRDAEQRDNIIEMMAIMRSSDNMPKSVHSRDSEAIRKVRYNVGQVFRHKRYHYLAVITGWDMECKAGPEWMEQNGVDTLTQGQHQSFYHVL